MKKLIYLLFLIPIISYSQIDSSKIKISVNVQARDCEYVDWVIASNDLFEDLDSVMKKRFRPAASAPTGNTNVSIDSISLKVWREVVKQLRQLPDAIQNNTYSRVDAVLRAAGQTWIVGKLDKDMVELDDQWALKRQAGRDRLKKTQVFP